jgi:hypothetical protein
MARRLMEELGGVLKRYLHRLIAIPFDLDDFRHAIRRQPPNGGSRFEILKLGHGLPISHVEIDLSVANSYSRGDFEFE